jgi:hypothetical protein
MKILGILFIAFGLVDLIGSYAGFDLWGDFLSVQLPEVLWKISSFIEIAIGYGLFKLGSREAEPATE